MDDLRCNPPQAVVLDVDADDGSVVPAAVLRKSRNAWIACLVSAGVTLAVSSFARAERPCRVLP